MSLLAESLQSPVRSLREPADFELSDRTLVDLTLAPDVASGMSRVVARLRREGGAARVEWWAPSTDGNAFELDAADGRRSASLRTVVALGPAGVLVVTGTRWSRELTVAVNRVVPVVRRRWTDEQLSARVIELARRNEALQDFASLVAHELKAPLHAALLNGEATGCVEQAVDLVDELLEAARSEGALDTESAPADVLRELAAPAVVAAELPPVFPLPHSSLRVVLRNLVANAVAAGAREVRVTVLDDATTLVVDDDGAGLDPGAPYASGSGIGFRLIRGLVARHGGSLELVPRSCGGTRAILAMQGGSR